LGVDFHVRKIQDVATRVLTGEEWPTWRWSKDWRLVLSLVIMSRMRQFRERISARVHRGCFPGVKYIGAIVRASWLLGRAIGGVPCPYQGLVRIHLLWVVGISLLALRDCRLSIVSFPLLNVSLLWCKKNTVSPAPANELAKLLKDEQVENTARCDFIVIIVRNSIPVESIQRLRKRDDKRDGK
jgi:hypothetical protein